MVAGRKGLFSSLVVVMLAMGSVASAEDWGRFYHYPYSYFPQNYRRPFTSRDFPAPNGHGVYPAYMAFPPYFRTDLRYPYHWHMKPGNNPKRYYQGNHHILDVF